MIVNRDESIVNLDKEDKDQDIIDASSEIEPPPIEHEYIYSIIKVGKKGISHKPRILHVRNNEIFYYVMISKNQETSEFLNELQKSHQYYRKDNPDMAKIKNMVSLFNKLNPEKYKKLKGHFNSYELEVGKKMSDCKNPIKITSKDSVRYEQSYWVIDTHTSDIQHHIQSVPLLIQKALQEEEEKRNNPIKDREEEEERQRKALLDAQVLLRRKKEEDDEEEEEEIRRNQENDERNRNQDNQEVFLINKNKIEKYKQDHDLEAQYQMYLKEYYQTLMVNKDQKNDDLEIKKTLIELYLYWIYSEFIKRCESKIKQIVKDFATLKADEYSFNNLHHPIVFPNSYCFSEESTSYLLYKEDGIFYTMTWHKLYYKMNRKESDSNSKGSSSRRKSKGNWKALKKRYKERNFFQDFFIKSASSVERIDEFPATPMCCIIDYEGFRFYCENEIYMEEDEDAYSHNPASQSNQLKFNFKNDLGKILSFNKDINANNIYDTNPSNLLKNNEDNKFIEKTRELFNIVFKESINSTELDISEAEVSVKFCKLIQLLDEKIDTSIDVFSLLKPKLTEVRYLKQCNILPAHPRKVKEVHCHQEIVFTCFDDTIKERELIENTNNYSNDILKSKQTFQILSQNIYNSNNSNNIGNYKAGIEFEKKLNDLLLALDSFYFKPYNSETLKRCFHHFGVNLYFLGEIAIRTRVPHVRELCVIDMFARVCKEMMFDLLASDIFENTICNLYENQEIIKLSFVPFSLKTQCGEDHFKSLILPVKDFPFLSIKDTQAKGIYISSGILKVEDENISKQDKPKEEKQPEEKEKKATDIKIEDRSTKIKAFLTTLFCHHTNQLVIYGKKINQRELWKKIIKIIKRKYDIKDENDEIFMYCNLECISNPGLLASIQYHSGIPIPFANTNMENLTGKDCILLTPEEVIQESQAKITMYDFTLFNCKKGKILPLCDSYSVVYPGDINEKEKEGVPEFDTKYIYPLAKLCYYADKILLKKKQWDNPLCFFFYCFLQALRRWDRVRTKKSHTSNDKKNKEYHIKEPESADTFDFNCDFEKNLRTFICLIDSQVQEKNISKKTQVDVPVVQNNLDLWKTLEQNYKLFGKLEKNIAIYWSTKHPYLCLVNTTFAKAMYKNLDNRNSEEKIKTCFKTAVEISCDAMGELNIYYGKMTRDAGFYYEKQLNFFESYRMYFNSFRVFNKHKKLLRKDFHRSIKHLTKSCIFLGRFQECFEYGQILIKEFHAEKKAFDERKKEEDYTEEDYHKKEEMMKYWHGLHIENFSLNLLIMAVRLRDYKAGIAIGNIVLYDIIVFHEEKQNYKLEGFKKWVNRTNQRTRFIETKVKDQSKDQTVEKYLTEEQETNINLSPFFEEYLKSLFENVSGISKIVLAKAIDQIETEYQKDYMQHTKDPKIQKDEELLKDERDKAQARYEMFKIQTINMKKKEFLDIIDMFYNEKYKNMEQYFNDFIIRSFKEYREKEKTRCSQVCKDNYNNALNAIRIMFSYFGKSKLLFTTTNFFKYDNKEKDKDRQKYEDEQNYEYFPDFDENKDKHNDLD